MNTIIRILSLVAGGLISPLLVFAAPPSDFSGVVKILLSLLAYLVPVIIAITLIVVLWAGAQLILHADNPNKRTENRSTLIWGILVLFIMISVWAIINIFRVAVFF